jgi:transcriptional regulator with XRE-family HTH domain
VGSRTEAGMTQADLAKKLHWDPSVISKTESGERRLSVWEFMAVARALGVDPSKMMERIERW